MAKYRIFPDFDKVTDATNTRWPAVFEAVGTYAPGSDIAVEADKIAMAAADDAVALVKAAEFTKELPATFILEKFDTNWVQMTKLESTFTAQTGRAL